MQIKYLVTARMCEKLGGRKILDENIFTETYGHHITNRLREKGINNWLVFYHESRDFLGGGLGSGGLTIRFLLEARNTKGIGTPLYIERGISVAKLSNSIGDLFAIEQEKAEEDLIKEIQLLERLDEVEYRMIKKLESCDVQS